MKKIRDYNITEEHLENYMQAALINSKQLIDEAILLHMHKYFARAYFLAIASVEESGKAYTAFEAKGRNLKNPGICNILKIKFEDHSNKITSGFAAWIRASSSPKEAARKAIDLIIDVKYGREKSMYVDVIEGSNQISHPDKQVRPKAANDIIEIAINCFHYTEKHIKNNVPEPKTSSQDKLLCINSSLLLKITEKPDFWEFYLSEIKAGNASLEDAFVTYHDNYLKKNKLFENEKQIESV